MRKSSPRLFARPYRLIVVCAILIGLVGFGVSVSSHSGGDPRLEQSAGAAEPQKAGPANLIASVFNFPMPLPSLTVTMTDQIVGDGPEAGKAGVGETIRYTVIINNGGPDPATNLILQDSIDPNTTLSGAPIISPLAANETYQSVGNMTLTSSAIGADCNANPLRSVTCNDTLRGATLTHFGDSQPNAGNTPVGSTLTITGKGTVVLNADGTFVFEPVAAFEGDVEFWYTLRNSTVTPNLTDTGKVTIQVGGANGLVWFVSTSGGNNNTFGTQSNPLSLAGFNTINNGAGNNPADNDPVFLFEGAHTGPVTLRNGQKFVGQDSSVNVDTVGAPAPKPGNSYPSNTGTPVSITAASSAITLGLGNTLVGFTVGNVGSANAAIAGTAVGTFRVRDVIINTNGRALDITTSGDAFSDATYTGFTSVSSSGGANNVSLIGLTGTLNLGSGALSGASGIAFAVGGAAAASGGTGNINYSGSITNTTSRVVSIRNKNGGTVNLSGALSSSTSSGNGIFLGTNTGATINFTGSITINVTSGDGFSASGGGTINVTGSNNIDTTSGPALVLNGVTVGSSGITFATVDKNANTGSNEAIDIDALTSSGGGSVLITSSTVAGTAAASALAGIDINGSSAAVTISSVTINDTDGAGIALTNNTAAISINGGTIGATNDTTGNAVDIDQGNANVTIGAPITKTTSNRIVEVTGRTGGTVTISGNLTCNASCSGINVQNNTTGSNTINFSGGTKTLNTGGSDAVTLDNNDSSTINFSNGGLDIDTTSGRGFYALNGATAITVTTGAGANTILTTTGTALSVANSSIGASGLTFESVNVDGNDTLPTNAIMLNTTGSAGGLTITGNGGANSGGTLRDTGDDAISLTSTAKVSLTRMNITSNLGSGIFGNGVNGFVVANGSITANGDNAANDESGIIITDLTGTNGGANPTSITNTTISNNFEFELSITNNGSGTLSNLTMSGNTISADGTQPNHGNLFNFLSFGTGSMTLNLTSGTFTGNTDTAGGKIITATAVQCDHSGNGGTMTCNVSGATFTNNNVGPQGSVAANGQLVVDFNNNNIQGSRAVGVNIFADANAPFTKTIQGKIRNNTIGNPAVVNSGCETGFPVRVQNEGRINVSLIIDNNDIFQSPNAGINLNHGISSANGTGTSALTITNNSVNNITNSRAIILNQNDIIGGGAHGTVCADVSGNSFSSIVGQAGDGSVMRLREGAQTGGTATFNVRQAAPTTAVNAAELDDLNGGNDPTGTKFSVSGSPNFNTGVQCSQPVNAMLLLQDDSRRQYFARNNGAEGTVAGSFMALFNSGETNVSTGAASVQDSVFSFDYVTMPAASAETAALLQGEAYVVAPVVPEIEKGAEFALAHGDNKRSETAGNRVSRFISIVADAISPSAHAAPAPMPALEVNESLGTLPANKSVTVVFDVTVNGPHPYATYTNNATVKADGVVPDKQAQTITPGDRYNTTTALAANPASPSLQGDTVTFTATVTPSEAVGTVNPATGGFVQFKDNGVNIGAPVACTVDGNNCKAELQTNSLSAATHPISAEYVGGTHHEPSTSSTISYVVNPCTATPVVNSTNDVDDGACDTTHCSLREAIKYSCTGITITFDTASGAVFDPTTAPHTIQLLTALPDINKNLTITGTGANKLDVRGKIATIADPTGFRVFNITSGTVNISGMTISNAGAADVLGLNGGGINNAGTLTLTEVTVKSNNASLAGGGIYNTGTLSLIRSTVSNNVALTSGGGISNSGTGTLTVTNSTIASNTANVSGGGIYSSTSNTATVESSTIALNSTATGGGINNAAGTFNITNTIVGNNTASTASPDLAGAFNSTGFNLFENTTGAVYTPTTGDKTGDPQLQPSLSDNGGPTLTLLPLGNSSPAIDAGNTALTVDQRNQPRERDNGNVPNATGGDASDIGAVEAPAPPNAPDLDAASDSGTVGDNNTSDNTPTFTIGGVVTGATVDLLDGGTVVATGTVTTTCLGLPCIQLTASTIADGPHVFTARQTVNGGLSPTSTGRNVTIDTSGPAAPTVDLQAAGDTGSSSTDDITNAATLSFDIGNTEAGILVELLRDGVAVSSTTSAGGTVVLTDSPAEGSFTYSARQTDTAGNAATSSGFTVGVDRTAPAVSSITRVNATPTGAATVDYTVTFNQPVTGVDAADFLVTMSGVSGASVTNVTGVSPTASYTVTVNTGSGDGTIRLDVADNDTIADVAGNVLGGAGDNGDFNGEVYAVDKTDPVVSSIVRASTNPTNAASVNFTVTFSEGVSGVDTTDFSLNTTGVTAPSITSVTPVDSSHYTVAVNTGTGDGTIRLDLTDNDSIIDQASKPLGGAGAQNFTTGEVYTVDKTAPSINIDAPSAAASNGSGNVTYTVTYSDTNFNTSTLAVGNITLNTTGTASATVAVDAGNGATRTVTLSGITGNGTIGISIAAGTASDTAGNTAGAAGPSATFVVDVTAPAVSSIVRADANPTSAASVNFTVTFSENVTGVDTTDFSLTTTGGVAGATVASVTGSNNTYTVAVNTGTGDGTIRLDLTDNDSIVDQAGTPLGGVGAQNFTTGEAYTVDKTDPSVTSIVRANANPTDATSVDFTVTFSEDVTGVDTTDFALDTTGVTAPSITNVTGSNTTYTVTVNTGTGDGSVSIDLNDNDSIIDQASKPLGGAGAQNFTTGEAYTIDKSNPTVDINRAAGQADTVTNAAEINFTATFSEPVTGFDSGDVSLSGANATTVAVTEIAPNDGTTYNIKVTGMNTSGTVTVSINAGAAQDGLGHQSTASTHTDNTVEYTQDSSATFVVNSLANTTDGVCDPLGTGSGNQDCTLREAIELANLDFGAETITFAPALTAGGPQTILLNGAGALPDITESVTITGPTNNRLTIDGNNNGRIFTIDSGQTVNISNLTVRNGNSPSHGGGISNAGTLSLDNMLIEDNTATSSLGGGIFNNSGATLTITNSTIDDNTANGGHGGGIYNIGTLTITNSTLSNNDAKTVIGIGGDGGAIDSDNGQLNVYNSTISGNRADGGGGGIHHCGSSAGSLVNVTITGNRSDMDDLSPGEGGGLEQVSTSAIVLKNTIVAGNTKGNASAVADDISVFGPGGIDLVNSKNNLVGDAATSGGITHGGANGNIVGNSGAGTITIGNVLDTALANNGGPTLTHRLVSGSPAINTGSNTHATSVGLTTDQRGTGFTRFAGSTDIGAYEVQIGIGDHLVFDGQPSNTNAGVTMAPAVTVRILDVLNNPTTSTANVTLALGSNPGGGTLSGTTTVAAVNGIATFSDLSVNNVGVGYTLVASSPGMVSATSSTFDIVSPSNISATKTVSGTFVEGSAVVYTITLSNSSSSAQLNNPGNEFADGLSPALTLVSASASSGTAVATVGTNTVTWNGSIPGNGSVTITINATIKNGTSGGTISNIGQIAYDADGNGTNETAGVTDDPGVTGVNNPTNFVVNAAPSIAAVGVTRTAGDAGSNATIANVNDTEDAENTLGFTVNGGTAATVNGVTVNGLSVSAGGVVTANVVAACGATNASFTLQVTDSKGLSNTAMLNVTVNPNSAPTLSYSSPQAVSVGGSLNINPATGPADSGTIGSITVLSPGTFTGTVSVNNSTGAVSISNAAPAGAHTITIRATDNCGVNTDASFTLNVNKQNQTVTFNPLGNKVFGDADFAVNATASSGLGVTFSALGACTVSGNTVHITGAGDCTITATQAGDANYNQATAQQGFSIGKAFTFTAITSSANPSAPGQNVTFTATVQDGGATPNGSIQFKVDGVNAGAPVALNGSGSATFSTSTLTVGTHSITADYSGNANFATNSGNLPGGQVVSVQTSLSIGDVAVTEGHSGNTNAVFTVTLSQSSSVPVTVDFATADGAGASGATLADSDYQSASGTLTFNVGELTKTITVPVVGDTKNEPNETFLVNLTNAQNANLADSQGQGTINNDDGPSIQLSNSTYSINEGLNNTPQGFTSLSFDVIRTGDTSQPATVRYLTSDQSGGNECNQNNTGFASQRCDYILVGAKLRFAAGETSKTVIIPIVNDKYVEPAEQFTIELQDAVGASLGLNSQAMVSIQDDDTTAPTAANNPYLSNSFFVRQNYLDFLGRDADQNGFTDWVNVLNNCGPEKGFLGAPPACDRAHVAHGFFGSEEFIKSGFLIYRMFEVGMNRLPLYREFIPDMASLSGFNLTQAQQQQNLADYLQEFTSKQEFINRFQDVSQPAQAAQFIARLEQTAGLTLPATATTLPGQPTQYNRQDLINLRASGQFSMGETLKAFVEQKVTYDRFFQRGHVTMLYFAYLRRDPSLNDPNLLGWNDWVNVFTNGGQLPDGTVIQPMNIHHLIFGFIYSEEYRRRFGQP